MRSMIREPTRSWSAGLIATSGPCARSTVFLVFLVALALAGCQQQSADSVVQPSEQQHQQQQEVPAPPEFADLQVPPADVHGLQTYEILEALMQRRAGGSACDDSRLVVVEHMQADGPGEYVRIPEQLSLDEAVPVALLIALETHRLPYAAYKFRWIEEWRIVMFASPRGAWSGSATQPTVIELTLNRVSERELSGDESAADDAYQFLWSVSSAASLSGCVPGP